jgi:copper chaperone CopZ
MSENAPSSSPAPFTLQLRQIKPYGQLSHLEKSLEAVPAVESVEIDPEERVARVTHHGADLKELLRVLDTQGYDAHVR